MLFFTMLLFISRFSYWYKRCCCIDRPLLYKLRRAVCNVDLCILPSAAQVSCLPQTTGRLLFRLLSHMSCVCTEEGETKSPSGRRWDGNLVDVGSRRRFDESRRIGARVDDWLGTRREGGSLFHRWGVVYRKERLVILRLDWACGWRRVTSGGDRVDREGWKTVEPYKW